MDSLLLTKICDADNLSDTDKLKIVKLLTENNLKKHDEINDNSNSPPPPPKVIIKSCGNRSNADKIGKKTKEPSEYSTHPRAIKRREEYERNRTNPEFMRKKAERNREYYKRKQEKLSETNSSKDGFAP